MKTFLIHILEKLKASAWTLPAFCTFCGIFLSQLVLWIDHSDGEDGS